jgi:acyl-CoA synthetase (AMP-forming)/AMP-acid ligase II
MERRWYSVWPSEIPKESEPEKSVTEYFRDWAERNPNRIALSFYGYDMTYGDLDKAIDRFALGLRGLGVGKGDRVALYMQNCPQFVISYFGILRAGGIVVSLNPMFKHAELEYELKDSGTESLIALDILYSEVEKIRNQVRLRNVILTSLSDYLPEKPTLPVPPEAEQPKVTFSGTLDFLELLHGSPMGPIIPDIKLKEDLALLQYTGGTTGLPKGAMISHYTLAHKGFISNWLWFDFTIEDVHLGLLPFFHAAGMTQVMLAPLTTGGRLVILIRFTPELVVKAIEQYKCTMCVAAVPMILAISELPDIKHYDLSSLRVVGGGGGSPMTPEICARLKRIAPNAAIFEGYGLSEIQSGGVVSPLRPPRHKFGTIGIPIIGTDVKIVDLEEGTKELGPNEEGEIVIRTPMMSGYWGKPEETQKVIREGWLYTGDIGKMDEEGYVIFVGRSKEMIKCSGFSVFPVEVEDLLLKHPAVADVAVIGIADSYRGQSPKAFIVLKPEYQGKVTEAEIIEWSKENMATYKRPREVEFRSELPRNAAGKILRRILVEQEKKWKQSERGKVR